MPLDHINFDAASPHGRLLRSALTSLELGVEGLGDITGTMAHLIDSDGSQDAHYATMAALFGIPTSQAPSGATARAAYNELLSVYGKLNTDSSVTNVKAALLQAFDKFR